MEVLRPALPHPDEPRDNDDEEGDRLGEGEEVDDVDHVPDLLNLS